MSVYGCLKILQESQRLRVTGYHMNAEGENYVGSCSECCFYTNM